MFKDLYHAKPPFLEGVWEGWSGSRVWDSEGKGVLSGEEAVEEGKMCRVVGRMKRVGRGWGLEVLGAMEVGWEDVEFVAGVYGVA